MKLLILGVGNLMMGDDGFGAAAVRELLREPLPDGVVAVDGGTAGIGLAAVIEEAERVVVLDTAEMGKPPGTLVQFSPEEVRSKAARRQLSLHQSDLLGTLRLMSELGTCPPVTIVAVQPARVGCGEGLSDEVRKTLPAVLQLVRALISQVASSENCCWNGGRS